jgi:diguanylate cyclase (GGDEF)-like protein
MKLMHEFVSLQNEHNQNELLQTTSETQRQRDRMVVLLVAGLALSLFIAIWVTRRIQHEIDRRNHIEEELESRVEERTRQLEQLAREDHVTALPNRSAFNKELSTVLMQARQEGNRVCLFFMDLDGFKEVNDMHGHLCGDQALVEIAYRLSTVTEGVGQLSRVGGDEFTLLIGSIDDDTEIRKIAEDDIRVINVPMDIDGHDCHVGISIGCAISDGLSVRFEDLLTFADDAMYAAKRAGKNRFVVIQ